MPSGTAVALFRGVRWAPLIILAGGLLECGRIAPEPTLCGVPPSTSLAAACDLLLADTSIDALVAGAHDDVLVVGRYGQPLTVEGHVLPLVDGAMTAFALDLDATCHVRWTYVRDGLLEAARLSDGRFAMLHESSSTEVDLSVIDGAGANVWTTPFAVTGNFYPHLLADNADNLFVLGSFDGAVDLGGGPVNALPDGVVLTKLDAFGHHVFDVQYIVAMYRTVIDSSGVIWIAGFLGADHFAAFGSGPCSTRTSPARASSLVSTRLTGTSSAPHATGTIALSCRATGVLAAPSCSAPSPPSAPSTRPQTPSSGPPT